eukprot:scaffold28788_cov23-Tisochrysis_lutea.AAC.1
MISLQELYCAPKAAEPASKRQRTTRAATNGAAAAAASDTGTLRLHEDELEAERDQGMNQ